MPKQLKRFLTKTDKNRFFSLNACLFRPLFGSHSLDYSGMTLMTDLPNKRLRLFRTSSLFGGGGRERETFPSNISSYWNDPMWLTERWSPVSNQLIFIFLWTWTHGQWLPLIQDRFCWILRVVFREGFYGTRLGAPLHWRNDKIILQL